MTMLESGVPTIQNPEDQLSFDEAQLAAVSFLAGNKPAKIPLVPRTARTIDLAVGERHDGPILRRRDGQRLDRRTARRWVRSIGKRAWLGGGSATSTPHQVCPPAA
jgi:hypothetical protein